MDNGVMQGWVWHLDRAREVVEVLEYSERGSWFYKSYKDVHTGDVLMVGEVGGLHKTKKQCIRAQLKSERYVLKTLEGDARSQRSFIKKLEKMLCT
jgi:hypothetical protein